MKQKRLGKRIVAWLMCLAMVLTTINLPAFTTEVKAEEAEEGSVTFWFCECVFYPGTSGKRCDYCVAGQHDNCRFRGLGSAYCYEDTRSWSDISWEGNITDTSIGGHAFGYVDKGLTPKSIIIPNGITNIEDEAFQGCKLLESITIPDSVINIGDNVFDMSNLITNVTAPCTLASSVDSWKGDNLAEVTYTHKYAVKDSDTHKCLVDGCAAEEAHSFTDGVCVCGYKESCSLGNQNFSTSPDKCSVCGFYADSIGAKPAGYHGRECKCLRIYGSGI